MPDNPPLTVGHCLDQAAAPSHTISSCVIGLRGGSARPTVAVIFVGRRHDKSRFALGYWTRVAGGRRRRVVQPSPTSRTSLFVRRGSGSAIKTENYKYRSVGGARHRRTNRGPGGDIIARQSRKLVTTAQDLVDAM